MKSLQEYLQSAPKPFVLKLHAKKHKVKGLIPAARLLSETLEWLEDENRLKKSLSECTTLGKQILSLVYLSGRRGLSESQILSLVPKTQSEQAAQQLDLLLEQLFVFRRQGEPKLHFGFRDLAPRILQFLLPDLLPSLEKPSENRYAYGGLLAAHFCHFLAEMARGQVKLTQTGELHRKAFQTLSLRFQAARTLADSAAEEEVELLLHFAAEQRLCLQEDGNIHPAPSARPFLEKGRDAFELRILDWWVSERLSGNRQALEILLASLVEEVGIGALANLLWFPQGQRPRDFGSLSGMTWDSLPRLMRELWLLGWLEFSMTKGRITGVRSHWERFQQLHAETSISSEDNPVALPTMECLLPLKAPLKWRYRLELCSERSNDELLTKYHFTKESVITGLEAGMAVHDFSALVKWLGFPESSRLTLEEWASSYASTVFQDGTVLRVQDSHRREELSQLPQFQELVSEEIPGYGFLLPSSHKPAVKQLLKLFGLVPAETNRPEPQLMPVDLGPEGQRWHFTRPTAGEVEYHEKSILAAGNPKPFISSRYAGEKKDLTLKEKLQLLEYGVVSEKKMEIVYADEHRIRVLIRPLMLLVQEEPEKLIAIQLDTGHRNEYLLERIRSLKVVD